MTKPTDVVRAVAEALRRADATLVHGAALNAAVSLADRQARQLEDARTMRDLDRLEIAAELARVEEGGAERTETR